MHPERGTDESGERFTYGDKINLEMTPERGWPGDVRDALEADGFEVLPTLKRLGNRVPVIVYTGTGSYDRCVRAVKLGMLSRAAVIEAVAQRLEAHGARNVVLDPVMVAKSGDALLAPEATDALRGRLLPLAEALGLDRPQGVLVSALHPASSRVAAAFTAQES